ncbi:YIP1 family protein [Halobacteria archaeon AArc-m2/3/4]|uniref:YIP1 family protein n=2 Tax=Natronoglomus mannanivorans TaxID=2979990 RepID=A0ABT2QGN7_9EURY|nr:YIP1 family protein [Halobacteria archaeon AArc-m2/3/4]
MERLLSLPETQIRNRFDSRGFRLEVVMVFVFGLVGSIGMLFFSWQVWSITDNMPAYTEFELTGEVVGPILFVFFVWILYTVTAHLLANLYGGRGPIVRLFRTSAWAMIPIALWLLLRSIVQIFLFYTMEFPSNRQELSNLGFDIEEQIASLLETGLEDLIYVATILLGIVFVVWSWNYLSIAVQESKDLSPDEAKKVAGVPAGILACYLLYLVFQWQPLF